MSAVADFTADVMECVAPPADAVWIAIDPEGLVFGMAHSFASCLEEARACSDTHVLEQIVRCPSSVARQGIWMQWVDVTVRPAAPRELTFP